MSGSVREFAMSKVKDVRWGKWAAAIAGGLVLFKSLVFVVARVLRLRTTRRRRGGATWTTYSVWRNVAGPAEV